MMIPTVHMNGTSKKNLLAELQEAHVAIEVAIDKLVQVTCHGRDYYPQGPHAYGQAREEMDRRFQLLQSLQNDLKLMYEGIDKQGDQG